MKLTRRDVFSIPNILSFVRILLIPIFMIFYLTAKTPVDYGIAAAVILLSGLTDMADGLIARKFGMITEVGKVLDPIADKLTQAAIVFTLIFRYPAMIFLFALLVVKELYMGINGLILLKKGKNLNGARWFGKLSTAVLYVVMFILIAIPILPEPLVWGLMLLAGGCLLLSFLMYAAVFVQMYRQVPAASDSSESEKVDCG